MAANVQNCYSFISKLLLKYRHPFFFVGIPIGFVVSSIYEIFEMKSRNMNKSETLNGRNNFRYPGADGRIA
jgi:hypothetical protein